MSRGLTLRVCWCLERSGNATYLSDISGADLAALAREAAVAALREFMATTHPSGESPAVGSQHFDVAFHKVKPSVSDKVGIMF